MEIKSSLEGENMQTQYSVLGYKIDLYFHDYKSAIEIDEYGHNGKNIDYEIKRKKQQNKNFVATLLELILKKRKDFDFFKATNEILRHIK